MKNARQVIAFPLLLTLMGAALVVGCGYCLCRAFVEWKKPDSDDFSDGLPQGGVPY
jgi:hypothetical protein